jgi:hypothetical protein
MRIYSLVIILKVVICVDYSFEGSGFCCEEKLTRSQVKFICGPDCGKYLHLRIHQNLPREGRVKLAKQWEFRVHARYYVNSLSRTMTWRIGIAYADFSCELLIFCLIGGVAAIMMMV